MRSKTLLLLLFICISASAHSVVEKEDYYEVRHSWTYKGKECSIMLNVSTKLYDYYLNDREHLAYHYKIEDAEIPVNFYSFILSDYDRPFLHEMAERFGERAVTDFDKVNLATTFVQSLPYAFDSDSKGEDEYVRYPVETIVDGCGDCEDKVVLLGALLYELGIDFVLLSLPEHLALAVRCPNVEAERYILFRNKKYYYVETTMEGWEIGQIPPDYAFSEVEAYPCEAVPTVLVRELQFESEAVRVYEKADCSLRLELHNLGPGRVTGLQLHVQVVSPKARLLEEAFFNLDDLPEGIQRTEVLRLKSLIKENSRLLIELSSDNAVPQSFELQLGYSKSTRW